VWSDKGANNGLNTKFYIKAFAGLNSEYRFNVHKISGEIALDHIRSIDKTLVTKTIGKLDPQTILILKSTLKEFVID
jgi:hypothetical protein